jgi:hypothetical protein
MEEFSKHAFHITNLKEARDSGKKALQKNE